MGRMSSVIAIVFSFAILAAVAVEESPKSFTSHESAKTTIEKPEDMECYEGSYRVPCPPDNDYSPYQQPPPQQPVEYCNYNGERVPCEYHPPPPPQQPVAYCNYNGEWVPCEDYPPYQTPGEGIKQCGEQLKDSTKCAAYVTVQLLMGPLGSYSLSPDCCNIFLNIFRYQGAQCLNNLFADVVAASKYVRGICRF